MTTALDLPTPGAQSVADRLRISRIMISEARRELIEGSRLQAGEKAWGAVVQPMKAVAQQRGWKHGSHQHVYAVMNQLVMEYGFNGDQVHALSLAYFVGHNNFYENYYDVEDLSEMMDRVEEILPALIDVTAMPPRPFTITSNTQLRRLRRLTGNDDLQIGDTSDAGFSLRNGLTDGGEG